MCSDEQFQQNSIWKQMMKPALQIALVSILSWSSSSCAQLSRLTGPVGGCLRRAAIVSVDIPPITLTPARTAAERQLIGEEQELEKNGRMLGSTRSTGSETGRPGQTDSRNNAEEPGLQIAREFYRQKSVLEFYEDFVQQFKEMELIGESHTGMLRIVPRSVSRISATRNELNNARRVTEAVNRTRQKLNNLIESSRKFSTFSIQYDPMQHFRSVRTEQWIHTRHGWEKAK